MTLAPLFRDVRSRAAVGRRDKSQVGLATNWCKITHDRGQIVGIARMCADVVALSKA